METRKMMVERFRDLDVYREAFLAARRLYELSEEWPEVERYALTDQIRRSSRSVSANIAGAWRKRRYPKYFASKLTDADSEAAETRAWLDFALDHDYLGRDAYNHLDDRYDKIQGSLIRMINNRDRWCSPADGTSEQHIEYTSGEWPPPK